MSEEIKRFRHHDRRLDRQRGPDPNFLADGVAATRVKIGPNSACIRESKSVDMRLSLTFASRNSDNGPAMPKPWKTVAEADQMIPGLGT